MIVLFSREHSYLLLPGVKGHQQPPKSWFLTASVLTLTSALRRVSTGPTSAHFGDQGTQRLPYFLENYALHQIQLCIGRVSLRIFRLTLQNQDASLHFLKITLAAPWRMDYKGQSGFWRNREGPRSVFQVRNDGFTQSGGSENEQKGMTPSQWSICLITCASLFIGISQSHTKMCVQPQTFISL